MIGKLPGTASRPKARTAMLTGPLHYRNINKTAEPGVPSISPHFIMNIPSLLILFRHWWFPQQKRHDESHQMSRLIWTTVASSHSRGWKCDQLNKYSLLKCQSVFMKPISSSIGKMQTVASLYFYVFFFMCIGSKPVAVYRIFGGLSPLKRVLPFMAGMMTLLRFPGKWFHLLHTAI